MKVTFTTDLLSHEKVTGVEKYLYHLIHALASIPEIELTLISSSPVLYGRLPVKVKWQEHKLGCWFDGKLFFPWIQRRKDLNQFDLVHYPTVIAPFFIKPERRYKSVMTVHDLVPVLYPEFSTYKKSLYYKYYLRVLLHSIDHLIVPSKAVRNDLISLFNVTENNISIVYEGVSNFYKPGGHEKKNYMLAVSTLEPRKNFRRIIDAFIYMKSYYKISEDLIIVGKRGWSCEDLFNIPKEFSQNIIFKGYVADQELLELYQGARVFVYPSLYEGFGLPVLEAMACGCPVVTSNAASLAEVAGDAAALVNPYSTEDIGESIVKILQNETLAGSMKEKGLKQAMKFTWAKCAQGTVDVYDFVLKS
jgi:glycosyltransferase involved in cell wall biosynthesis